MVGNTLDPNGTNLTVELVPNGHVLATKNVGTGATGGIFGMVATGTEPPTRFSTSTTTTTTR